MKRVCSFLCDTQRHIDSFKSMPEYTRMASIYQDTDSNGVLVHRFSTYFPLSQNMQAFHGRKEGSESFEEIKKELEEFASKNNYLLVQIDCE